ncbi:hypothetical protein Lqui_2190 [Legionella quinlivanii]|uniref:Uncharacterized protein n=1 Tax=Legionella quinlivanii TaxID=45073 RepID=A0A0W0XU62_9GAMM|nr:hypothetical protein [Legionella quinlivanii]KTD47926.1 hypothetical protein Lqui_2190 [Legionella quinlivanii]SEG19135.1 hypothetical protein SAMN02746093_02114 [Legionella quinlivanii DSM 21216]STY11036.1 Uncharacterised protein [Legionella quinlivanii]
MNKGLKEFKRLIRNYKTFVNTILLLLSGYLLIVLLTDAINTVNSAIEERDKLVISEIQMVVKDLSASQIPSVEKKMYFLPEAVASLTNLGVKIPSSAVIYLIFSYAMWLIFKRSYTRLEDAFFNWLD